MNQAIRNLLAASLATAAAVAQAEASTLATLSLDADHVVVARAVHRSDPDEATIRVAFERIEDLKGSVPARFSLSEPAGACCSQLLFTIDPGEQLVLFVDRMGPRFHLRGGARAGVEATPSVVEHVRALCTTADPVLRAGLLAEAVDSDDERVRRDAILALAVAPVLPQASPAFESRIAKHLGTEFRTMSPDLPALVRLGARLDLAPARQTLLDAYLDAVDPEEARALRRWVASYPAASIAGDLAGRDLRDTRQTARTARLLAELPTEHALPLLQRLGRQAVPGEAGTEVARAFAVHGVRTVMAVDAPPLPERPRLQVVPAGRRP